MLLCCPLLLGVANAIAGKPAQPSAVAKAESNSGVFCPFNAGDNGPAEVPGVTVSLETHGRPVVLQFTSGEVGITTGSTARLRPLIDGQTPDDYFVEHNTGFNNPMTTTLTLYRIYDLPAGTHSFGAQLTCEGPSVTLGRRWLTVYELP
jgi:hypothetical protein